MRRLISAVLLSGCLPFADPSVVDRRVRGETHEGRFVDDTAYEVALSAALFDAAGDHERAEGSYLLLTRLDPDSGDAWSRLGLTRCRRGVAAGHVDAAFERAERAEPTFAPTFARRATCHLLRHDRASARRAAQRAFDLDPTSVDASLALADVARAEGDVAAADRLMRGLRVRAPIEVARVLDRPRVATARDVDLALLRGRFDDARDRAAAAGVTLSHLSLRAAALGRVAFARELSLSLVANADDIDAQIALFASDPSRAAVGGWALERASPLGVAVLRDVCLRRGMAEAAESLRVARSEDPLVAALVGRR